MKWNTREVAARAVALAVTAIAGKMLSTPRATFLSQKLDQKVDTRKHTLATMFRKRKKNAGRHRGLAIAGLAALAVGTALLAGSARK